MSKPKILIILQNFYAKSEGKFRKPVYNTDIINRRNATYSRIVPYLEDEFELWFTECTPYIADNKNKKFKTDLDWVKSALEYDNWFAVLAFSTQAHKALEDLQYTAFKNLPHPVSFKWRKTLIQDCKKDLIELKTNLT
jgi:hypothetical protein